MAVMRTALPILTADATGGLESHPFHDVQPHATPAPLCDKRPSIDSLYIHIPFCFHKCHYCDFYSVVDQDNPSQPQPTAHASGRHPQSANDRQADFTDRLIQEIQLRATQTVLHPHTLFAGGGTPTLLRIELWQRLLDTLRQTEVLSQAVEFTIEANPETVTPQLMATLAAGGINRVSIGAQSFNRQLLKTLERWHDPANVGQAVRITHDAGITNINLDLIFAIPGQTLDMLDADLDAALALEPQHLSCYGLTYEPHTPLTARRERGQITAVDEMLERRMYEYVMDRLAQAGYEHYEVSNWTKPDKTCQHNLGYWHNQNWLGVGPAAASHVNGTRWKNVAHLGQYLSHAGEPKTVDHEYLPQDRRLGEQLMLGLRLRRGVPQSWLAEHLTQDDPRHGVITELINLGMLQWRDGYLRLTRKGLFVADTVIGKLL